MKGLGSILRRELRLRLKGGAWAASLGLFAVTAGLSPLALGPQEALLAATAPALLWVLASLSLLIGFEGLYEEDLKKEGFTIYRLTPVPLSLIILIKMSVAWVGSCLPLVLISPALFSAFGVENVWQGALGFLLGTPGLAFISGALSALCASLKRGTVMIVFLAIPLFAPAFVFGPATLSDSPLVPFLIMAIFSLQALALCPFIAAAAIRTHMS